jgi:hypothetical protein
LHSVPRYGLTVYGMNLPTFAPHPGPAPADWVPVDACTLPSANQPLRLAEFDDLFPTALRAIERRVDSGRARLMLAGGDDLADRVQRLTDAETACCSFFTFTLTPLSRSEADAADETVLALDIEVPVARADVLATLIQRAEHARQATA